MFISEEKHQDDEEPESHEIFQVEVKTKDKKGWSTFYITVEPIKFCVGFTMALTAGVTIDLLQRNACYRKFNISYSACFSPDLSTEIKADVEAMAAEVNMIINVIQGICPLILVLFIGPWSDINGRKPFILWALRGFMVYYFLWALFAFFPHMPVIYFFIPSIPLGLTGGFIAMDVCTWSYFCDNFDSDDRTMRFTLSTAFLICGTLLGNALAEQILHLGGDYGFQAVFSTSFFAAFVGLLYTIYVVEETVIRKTKKKGRLIDIAHVKSIIKTVILKPKGGRLVIALILLALATEIPAFNGDEAMYYYVGKSHYNWTLGKYNLFAAISSFLSGFVPVVIIWMFMDKYGMSNCILLVLTTFVHSILLLVRVLSVNETMFWIMSFLTKSCNLIGACIDSELVDTVADNNVGKAFTFTSLLVALSPLLATPLYTVVYTHLQPDRTIYVYCVTFGLSCVTFLACLGLYLKTRRSPYALPRDDPSVNVKEASEPSQETSPLSDCSTSQN